SGSPLLTIADNESPAKETAEAFQEQIKKIGLKLQFREVPHATMLTKFCQVPKSNTAICPNLGWGADFFSSQSMIDPLFNGKIDKAKAITNPADAAKAWGDLDKDVTNQVFFIPWLWDNNIGLQSKNM